MYSLIVAHDLNNVIGINGEMPWKMSLKEDLKRVKSLTLNNIIVMGTSTFKSLGKPLPNRLNIVISNSLDKSLMSKYKGLVIIRNISELERFKKLNKEIFIFGGSAIYKQFIDLELIDKLYLTIVVNSFKIKDLDEVKYFPKIDNEKFKLVKEQNIQDGKYQLKFKDLVVIKGDDNNG